ncbi:uncharacterized protein LOC121377382 isoform X2 [Gigantopelta aegis]|uniref:uncharacterized protein LOC121377382 isoform X2 n=1 Tax=Gigantopelta aegis TaxID=1735272 RepID=UPI001B8886BA|nr:uncharacterized protein LOC121377382 isoform X2 [Gigantopelta aegis]
MADSSTMFTVLLLSTFLLGNLPSESGAFSDTHPRQSGPVCFDCEATINPDGCAKRRTCAVDHVCLIYSFREPFSDTIMFTQACHPRKHCLSENSHGDPSNLYTCCDGDLCNVLNVLKTDPEITSTPSTPPATSATTATSTTIATSATTNTSTTVVTTPSTASTTLTTTVITTTTPMTTTPSTTYHPCIENWVVGPKACYHFNDTHLSWNAARDSCRNMGGDLVSVNDIMEDNFVISHLAHVDIHFASQVTFWIGGMYDFPSRKWLWVDSSLVEFTRWSHNEPSSMNHGYAFIAVVDSQTKSKAPAEWEWVSMNEGTDLPFICEQSFR